MRFKLAQSYGLKGLVPLLLALFLLAGWIQDSSSRPIKSTTEASDVETSSETPSEDQEEEDDADTRSQANSGITANPYYGSEAIEYLNSYGYLSDEQVHEGNSLSEDAFEDAVKKFQQFYGIKPSGKLCRKTNETMKAWRCGNKDFETFLLHEEEEKDRNKKQKSKPPAGRRRVKRYALFGQGWQTSKLYWNITSYPRSLADRECDVDDVFDRVFKAWSKVTPLKFERKLEGGKVDIEIKFVSGEHECSRGALRDKVLAHSFPPQTGDREAGDMHFDNRYPWSIDASSGGKSLYSTALHEVGHSLGLGHSNLVSAKMYAIENGVEELHPDDITGIQQIYKSVKLNYNNDFYKLPGKRLVDTNLDLYETSRRNMDDCAKYAFNSKVNLTVWNQTTKKCGIKFTDDSPGQTIFTETGKAMALYDVYGSDHDTTESVDDMIEWIKSKQCDIILRLEDWPKRGHTSYKCKIFAEDDCCTILLRTEKKLNIPNLMKTPRS